MNSLIPFAIIGANEYRSNPNGSEDEDDVLKLRILNKEFKPIDIDNAEINDFTILKNVLLVTHLNEFKDITHDSIYENYRTEALLGKQFQYVNKDSAKQEISESDYLMKEEQIKLEEEIKKV